MNANSVSPFGRSTTFRVIASDGVALVGDRGGNPSAPTIVLMHGGGQTRHSWETTMQGFVALGYQVVNYDARGHGESDWSSDAQYTFPRRVKDLANVLEKVDGPYALIGASMGGITALQALNEGMRPAAVVLVDIVLRPERSGVERIHAFMAGNAVGFANLDEAIAAVMAYNPNRPNPGDPNGLMRNLRLRPDGRLYWHWDPRMLPQDMDEDMAAIARIIDGLMPANSVPTLLVRGGNSDLLTDANVAEFRRYLPHAEIHDVAGAGHMVAGDNNHTFMSGVGDFLARHLAVSAHNTRPAAAARSSCHDRASQLGQPDPYTWSTRHDCKCIRSL